MKGSAFRVEPFVQRESEIYLVQALGFWW